MPIERDNRITNKVERPLCLLISILISKPSRFEHTATCPNVCANSIVHSLNHPDEVGGRLWLEQRDTVGENRVLQTKFRSGISKLLGVCGSESYTISSRLRRCATQGTKVALSTRARKL